MSTVLANPPAPTYPQISVPASTPPPPYEEPFGGMAYIRKFTVDEYHRMIEAKILTKYDPVELLEGYLVIKMPRSPEHDYALMKLERLLHRLVPDPYLIRGQCAATFKQSEPEPDFTIIRGPDSTYRTRHPGPADTAAIVEVSASSLRRDRGPKSDIYARGGIPVYWIVNVEDRKIEVYTNPSGSNYPPCIEYFVGDSVPLVLDGNQVGAIAVAEVMS